MSASDLALIAQPQGHLLVKVEEDGTRHEMLLSASDVARLARLAHKIQAQILARQRRTGVDLQVHGIVSQVRLNTDLHQTEILLGMLDQHGAEARYALPLEAAKELATRLPARIAEIETTASTRTKQ